LRYIQELLGHNSSKTTEIYTMLVQKAYNKLRVYLMICKNKNDILTFTLPLQLGVKAKVCFGYKGVMRYVKMNNEI
jgi:hypothetical protein